MAQRKGIRRDPDDERRKVNERVSRFRRRSVGESVQREFDAKYRDVK